MGKRQGCWPRGPMGDLAKAPGIDPAPERPGGTIDRRLVFTLADRPDFGADAGRAGVFVLQVGLDPAWLQTVLARAWREDAVCGLCLSSASLLGGPIIEQFLDQLGRSGWVPADRATDVMLALTELVANAVLHGNLGDLPPCDAPAARLQRGVAILATTGPDEIALSVIQEGPGLSALNGDEGALPETGSPNGRGLFIVNALADRVEFDEDRAGCTIGFRTDRTGPPTS